MKNFKFKNKLISICSIFVIIGAFLASVFSGVISWSGNFAEDAISHAVRIYDESVYNDYADVVIEEITNSNFATLDSTYSLKRKYPVLAENQTESVLCWAYSSSKALETALMIQTGEYHNFSETAVAYYGYQMGKIKAINSMGSFAYFDDIIRTKGIVLESDFSNDLYFKLNEENVDAFSYIDEYADTNIPSEVRPIYLSRNFNFAAYNTDKSDKFNDNVIKYYIKNYGGLNLAIPQGKFYIDSNTGMYTYTNNKNLGGEYDGISVSEHAICLIGWTDAGFLALNSWGVDDSLSYEEIIIPYNLMDYYYDGSMIFGSGDNSGPIVDWLCGYDYVGGENVVLETTSADEFSNTIVVNSENPIKNMFCFTESIELVYSVRNFTNFDSVYTKVFKGSEDVTSLMNISYNDSTQKITITYSPTSANFTQGSTFFAGGSYSIRVYEDVELIGTKAFSIFTGTEVSYIKVSNNADSDDVYYSLMNNFASSANTDTYYMDFNDFVSGGDTFTKDYDFGLYLTDLNEGSKTGGEAIVLRIREFKLYNKQTGEFEAVDDDLKNCITYDTSKSSTSGNKCFINISQIPKSYVTEGGCLIQFRINMTSPIYSDCTRAFYFQIFVSAIEKVVQNDYSYDVLYIMNGGKNNVSNTQIYPIYSKDSSMTSVKLWTPTHVDSTSYAFEGWYTDAEFENEFSNGVVNNDGFLQINSNNSGFLVLYAKWAYINADYYQSTLTVSNIYNYDKTDKNLTGLDLSEQANLVYGESIRFKSVFEIKDALTATTFSFKYYYYVNGELKSEVELVSAKDMGSVQSSYEVYFGGAQSTELSYPTLDSGTHSVCVVAVAIIRHKFSIAQDIEFLINVSPKEVFVNYDSEKSNVTYDAKDHLPVATFDGYYSEDAAEFKSVNFDGETHKNVGTYKYNVVDIKNKNYYLNENDKAEEYLLVIGKKKLTIDWDALTVTYNGRKQVPVGKLSGLEEGDSARLNFNSEGYMNVGIYKFILQDVTNPNYTISESQEVKFEIKPAPITIRFDNIEERAQKSAVYRTKITFTYDENELMGNDTIESLNIVGKSDGLTKTESGEYIITGEYNNDNYDVTFAEGTYLLTGYYYVYYTLPNGEVYRELVNYGETPKGITKDIYKPKGIGAKLVYSDELVETGDDIYIIVTEENNTIVVLIAAMVVGFVVVYLIASRKARRNKVA